MKLVTTAQMRELDRRTIEEFGVPGEILMERAGRGVAEAARDLAELIGRSLPSILILAGKGNNGGDAFVAARHLAEWGFPVEVRLAACPDDITGDALRHFDRMRAAGVLLLPLPRPEDWSETHPDSGPETRILVDGLLGTGLSGPARGPAAAAIRFANALSTRCPILSIDVPSGLDSDNGQPLGDTVKADLTVTMGLPKRGLADPAALDFVGNLSVVDIGIPAALVAALKTDAELLTATDLRALFPPRPRHAHKGTLGHALIIGGAPGYAGAVAMAAMAALRSGVGLVSVLVPQGILPIVAGLVPEAMVHPGAETASGSLSTDALSPWNRKLDEFDAVLVGPGMTTHDASRAIVRRLLSDGTTPLVMDADALNTCAGNPECVGAAARPVILTPHPGELGRLLSLPTADIQADRRAAARVTVETTRAVLVLKGAGTLIAAPDRPLHINLTGNPGMATGGMGDVLGGLLAGFCAAGMAPFDAARAAVFLHGRAGDIAAWRRTQTALTARDVISELPRALREVLPR